MDHFKEFQASGGKVTADVVKVGKELELKVEPEGVTQLL